MRNDSEKDSDNDQYDRRTQSLNDSGNDSYPLVAGRSVKAVAGPNALPMLPGAGLLRLRFEADKTAE